MKIWWGYGSEHSMNLVMIGRFASDAEATEELIQRITTGVQDDIDAGNIEVGEASQRFSTAMLDLLMSLDVQFLRPTDLEQFAYDANVVTRGDSVIIRTDEYDVQAYLKVLLMRGARIDVFSAHDYPEDGNKLSEGGVRRHG
jgi:hypothetical protein